MTPKERLLTALNLGKPDRLPATLHQWQDYHLKTYMGGMDALEAFRAVGLDAAIQDFQAMGQYYADPVTGGLSTPEWRDTATILDDSPTHPVVRHTIETPEGTLTYQTEGDGKTIWVTEYLIKHHEDIRLIEKYMPVGRLDKERIRREYDRVGDDGILRGAVWGDQAGCWQHACTMKDTAEMVLECLDNPDWVHELLRILLEKKLRFIEESLAGAKYDLIETGGGASSDTVIGPALHREFCLPYDRKIHEALRAVGHKSTYHTCGGMMNILDQILENGCDASETLSPPGVGGNIEDPAAVRRVFGGKIAMIGGMDQYNVLTAGTPEEVRCEVHRLFEGFGPDGGYICCASDHFFDAPVENLRAMAEAARECTY